MGKADTLAKQYLSDNRRFADAFNFYLFDGKQVIQPDDLVEQDSTEVLSVLGVNKKEISAQKWRDLLKQCVVKRDDHRIMILLGIENQTDIHWTMPVRSFLYDALNYGQQIQEASRRHKKEEKESLHPYSGSSDFLSKFTKEDKLTPVITLTIYWGAKPWNAPRKLSDMFSDEVKPLSRFINDYKANIIVPSEIDDFTKFSTEVGAVLGFLKNSDSESDMEHFLANTPGLDALDWESANMIQQFAKIKIDNNNQNTEVVDMCKAWEDHAKHAAERAAKQAEEYTVEKERIRTIKELLEMQLPIDAICKASNWPKERVQAVIEQLQARA